MKSKNKLLVGFLIVVLPVSGFAWSWMDLWQTPDQQGISLLRANKPKDAARVFADKDWQAAANYRAGDYSQAYQRYIKGKSSDAQYNAGNAAAFQQQYENALAAYDKAIALNPNNTDAITNRDIIKKLMQKQKQQQQQQSSSSNNNKDKQQQDKNNNSAQQDQKQKDQQQKDRQQNQQQSQQPNQQQNNEQAGNKQKPSQDKPQSSAQKSTDQVKAGDEEKKQMLRRLADDPGGLLRQKFLRDYYRRHGLDDNSEQG